MEERKITFEDIQKANETIITTDIKGKDYAEVNQRIKAFRMVYPTGGLPTEIIKLEDGIVVMKCSVYDEEGNLLATGTAYEKENSTFINKTSYIENCETSAVGRALGMAGFGIDTSVASADEVRNAITNQEEATIQTQEEAKKYIISFGKYKDKTLGEVVESDSKYCDWLLYNSQDPNIKKGITLITGIVPLTEAEQEETLDLTTEMNKLVQEKKYDYDKLLAFYKVSSNAEMSLEQLRDAVSKLRRMK